MNTTALRRVEFLGCPVDCLTSDALLAELTESIRGRQPAKVIQFVNANKVAMVRSESSMGAILERSDYVLADGQPMLPLAAMLGITIPERIDGIGLMPRRMFWRYVMTNGSCLWVFFKAFAKRWLLPGRSARR